LDVKQKLKIFQTSKIRELLCRRKDITVDSVECFQGSERRVIIISLSRSEQLGFLSEYKVLFLFSLQFCILC